MLSPSAEKFMQVLRDNPGLRDDAQYQQIVDAMPRDTLKQWTTPSVRAEIDGELRRKKLHALRSLETAKALEQIEAFETDSPRLKIGRNDCSRLHRLEEAIRAGDLYNAETGEFAGINALELVHGAQVFVLTDDWAAVIHEQGEVELPAPHCAFEMVIGGVPIICVALQHEGTSLCQGFVMAGSMWVAMGTLGEDSNLFRYARQQMIAAVIAIEAEVAEHVVTRQPIALNAKRQKAGKPPLRDFHVVNLAKRHRIANPSGGHTGSRKRLHFRRGHWRHFEASKTWVKWCLVGDPALGVVGKEYRI